ncbi:MULTISPECIES: 2Fe-2S iron-sulfur cluster binding domain-containing protein [unclassified Paludibacterium]|uniref:2Fe-2S iron-sulfur cluster binding domain-containing protein n=1 Tax=unclassified Paludibacterium TaxID=2618429 RepID=UPI001C0522B5|nr:2Fe-2S iron-sulfur cluster binding domain-containing protein [Paludibacterium sp. B53371]BEV71405.1 2Fe-2S iron-sulfur cluster binding domain-containing protein [Paludibacterium sp. THUN1379]
MKAQINNKECSFEAQESILQVARRHGVFIPTLCELHDQGHAPGTCRVCLVEVKREGAASSEFVTACDTPMQEGLQVMTRTQAVQDLRRVQVELIMAEHNQDCAACSRHGDCELLDVAEAVGVRQSSCSIARPGVSKVCEGTDNAIRFDPSRCIRCMRCVAMCRDIQGVDALSLVGRGAESAIELNGGDERRQSDCVSCGQCVMVCPTGALSENDQTQTVMNYLVDPEIVTVFQIAPAIRVGFGQEFGLPAGTNVEGQVVAALRQIGADVILDTNFAADLVIMEEGNEVLGRVLEGRGTTFTSCCPGWVDFAEKHFPDILPMVSSTRSPQQCLGSLAKTYLAKKMDIEAAHIRVVSIMPCTAKKQEAARPELAKDGIPDVDVVLTIREFARLLRREGVDLAALEPSAFDNPLMSEYTGAGVIFGTTGGVMEAAIRTLYFVANGKELEGIEVHEVRGFDHVREASIEVGGQVGTLNVAMVHGLKGAAQMAQAVLDGAVKYDFIEVMACPGGCIDGGGHLRSKKGYLKHAEARRKGLYAIDRKTGARQSHRNQQVQKLYQDFLGEPLSHVSHELLHTHYHAKPRQEEV